MIDEHPELYSDGTPWECPLCSVANCKGEQKCRLCGLPAVNSCTGCKKELDRNARFCKHCGEMSVYFRYAVYDDQERALAKASSKKSISRWRRHGVRYLNIEDEYEYVQQLRHYGEIIG